jgi:hypothetical protein
MELEFLTDFYFTVDTQLYLLLALMFADVVFGTIVSIVQKRFSWDYLPQFLVSNGVWILAWFFSEVLLYYFSEALPQNIQTLLSAGIYLPIASKIGASLLGHWSALGVFPKALEKVAVRPTGVEEHDSAVG